MTALELLEDIKKSTKRPKAIIINKQIFQDLKDIGLIAYKPAVIKNELNGSIRQTCENIIPAIDGNIAIRIDEDETRWRFIYH